MRHRIFSFSLVAVALSLATVTALAQAPGAYIPPKTPWGDPDLQGLWPTTRQIPLQKRLETDPGRSARTGQGPQRLQDTTADANGSNQPALIVDPPNGRVPELTPEGAKWYAEARDGRGFPAEWREEADKPEDMNLYYRCITRGIVGTMMYSSYNNGNRIMQIPGYVIINQEMIHETRIIPLDGRPHVSENIRMYMGDGRGHWEGNTLVVETTNMTDLTSIGANGAAYDGQGGRHTQALKLTERFTRTAPDTLQYEVKIDDPHTWSTPWTIAFPMTLDQEYFQGEYACHEGNYAMENILTGHRLEEEQAQ